MSRRIVVPAAVATTAALALTALTASSAAAVEELTFIATGNGPTYVEFSPDGTTAYVANQGADSVSVIDVATGTETAEVQVLSEPHGIDVTPDGSQVYVTNMDGEAVSIIDTATNTLADWITLNRNWSFDIDFTPDGTKAYVTNYNDNTEAGFTGSVTIIDVATASVITTLSTPGYPQGIEVTPDGTKAYAALTGNGIAIIDVATNTVDEIVAIPQAVYPNSIVFSPDGATAYLSCNGNDTVAIYDVATQAIVGNVAVGKWPQYLDITPDGSTLYVSFAGSPTVGVQAIDIATATASPLIPAGTYPLGVAVAPNGNGVYVASATGVSVLGDPVTRVSGPSRYETAIAISQQAYPATASTVWVATGANYPDALAAGPAAAAQDAPLLLTETAVLTPAVAAEIQRLDPDKIVVVGGLPSVSAATYSALAAIQPNIERISGPDRFATSRAIAEYAFLTDGADAVYVATGLNFPDALSAGSAGAASGTPVILVNGTASTVDAATVQLISDLGAASVTIAGGTNQVSAGIQSQLSATRIAGTSRYETSRLVNEAAYPGTANRVLLATGLNFPDALAGSAWAGALGAPLFVVPGDCIPQDTLDKITALDPSQITLLGGLPSLNQNVFDLVACV